MPGCEHLVNDPEAYAQCKFDEAFYASQYAEETAYGETVASGEGTWTSYDPEAIDPGETDWGYGTRYEETATGEYVPITPEETQAHDRCRAAAEQAAYDAAMAQGMPNAEAMAIAVAAGDAADCGETSQSPAPVPVSGPVYVAPAAKKSPSKAAGYILAGVGGLGVVSALAYLAFRR